MASQDAAIFALDKLIGMMERNLQAVTVTSASKWSNTRWDNNDPIENEFEITYTLTGTRIMRYGNEEYTSRSGELMFWDSRIPGTLETGYFTYAYIIFKIEEFCPHHDEMLRLFHDCFGALRNYTCPPMERHYLEGLFLVATTELIAAQEGFRLSAKLALFQVVISIRRFLLGSAGGQPVIYDRKQTGLITDMIGYLSEHLDRRITLDELGERYGKNPRHLNRVFKSITGSPVLHYINKMKVEKAKKLLLASSMNQLEIALELGLRSGQYFNRFFHKETGMTPAQYRKSIRRPSPGRTPNE